MFKLKYNILVILQITLGILNYILLLRVFGISIQSDAYLLATSSILIIFSLITLPISQIIPFYNDLKVKSVKQSHEFYNCSIFISLCIGFITFIMIDILLPFIAHIFALGIDNERFELFKSLLQILSICLIFYPLNQVNEQLFNAEMKFSLPYILSCVPLGLITIVQIAMIKFNSLNITYLAWAQSIGFFLVSIFGTWYISKTLIKLRFVKWHYLIKDEIKNSITYKLGEFGYGIAIPLLFNNFLATLPKGYISYFYYARRILDIANNFTIGPSARILRSKISKFLAQQDFLSIKKISKSFLIWGGFVFIIAIIFAYYLQTPILKIITANKLSDSDLNQIALIFLTLVPWYIIIFLENPFVAVTLMSKKAKEILCINMTFLIIFAPLLFLLRPMFGIYALGFSTSIAQISNLILYITVSIKCLKYLKNSRN